MIYEVSEYQTHHPAVVVFLCIVYAVLSLVAFAGNALVIWIIREFPVGVDSVEKAKDQNGYRARKKSLYVVWRILQAS